MEKDNWSIGLETLAAMMWRNSDLQFRMVAELELTRERESTSCTMDDRETTFEFKEERDRQ
eukprot:258224-Amphidinium_carterae.1